MLFSSLIFIFRFMPIFFIIYYLVPARWKNAVLFSGSLIFYAVGELKYVPLVLAAIGVNYFLVRAMGPKESEEAYAPDISGEARIRLMRRERKEQLRRRFLLSMALTFDIGMLVLFKYTSFILKTIDGILHIGLTIPEIPHTLAVIPALLQRPVLPSAQKVNIVEKHQDLEIITTLFLLDRREIHSE